MGKKNVYAMCKNCVHTCTDTPCDAYCNLAVLWQVLGEALQGPVIDYEIIIQEAYENITEWMKKDES